MNDRIPKAPPIIAALAANENRPLWSVMVPSYNCLKFLRYTLESVLAQDQGQDDMQIEVVDDCSTDGDVEQLVKEIGHGRISFYKQQHNRGSLRNFETCLNRSKGKLVHLLHGDDAVRIGFYKEIEGLFDAYPEIGAAYTKSLNIDADNNEEAEWESDLYPKKGIIKDFLTRIAGFQQLQPPAIVVKRSVYEHLGSFFAVKYGEDWEMWARIAANYQVAFSPAPLALYRAGHGSNITNQSIQTGQNISDIAKVIDIIQSYLPADKKQELKNEAQKNFSIHYAMASNRIYPENKEMAFVQARGALKLHKNLKTLYYILKLYLIHFLNILGLKPVKKVSLD
jgi:glycosyltransferase involved in cell wall biosynthesis